MKNLNISKFAVPVGVIGIIVMMVVPLPTFLLDLLIALNITGALLILLVSMFVQRPLDFSVFPSLLLVATLFRLALNISATRLVLRDGYAGKVIDAFGHFVVGGSLVIGLVIFLILIVIQFVVITKGAERVAEVGARFTLDAMPGKQMAIDADLNAGLIDEDEARSAAPRSPPRPTSTARWTVARKFVKGDAIAAIIITLINLVGGFAIGMLQQRHVARRRDATSYSLLTVGDGLVSQIPALLLSVATGLIVTRSATDRRHGHRRRRRSSASTSCALQHRRRRRARAVPHPGPAQAAVPARRRRPCCCSPSGCKARRRGRGRRRGCDARRPPPPDSPEASCSARCGSTRSSSPSPPTWSTWSTPAGGDLLDRVRALRRKMATGARHGHAAGAHPRRPGPAAVDVRDPHQRGRGRHAARRRPAPSWRSATACRRCPAGAGVEPVFGLAGKWVPAELRYQAELSGATVVDRASVIITHLAEVVRSNASRLLGREDVRALTDMVKRTHPVVVEELTPALLSLGQIQRVLQALLDEGVPIRDLVRIFEALSLRAKVSADHDGLVEAARAALGPAIAAQYASERPAHGDHPRPDARAATARVAAAQRDRRVPGDRRHARRGDRRARSARLVEAAEQQGPSPVLACSPQLRLPLMRLLRAGSRRVQVLSYSRNLWFHRTDRDHGGGERCLRGCCLRDRPSSRCWPRYVRSTAPASGSSRPTRSVAVASAASSRSSTTSSPSRCRTPIDGQDCHGAT